MAPSATSCPARTRHTFTTTCGGRCPTPKVAGEEYGAGVCLALAGGSAGDAAAKTICSSSNKGSGSGASANVQYTRTGCPLTASSDCGTVQCLTWPSAARTVLEFFIPFGADTAGAPPPAITNTSQVPMWQRTEVVQEIGALALPETVEQVNIIGGPAYEFVVERGRRARVDFATNFLDNAVGVTTVKLANLKLYDRATAPEPKLPPLPSTLKSLALKNCGWPTMAPLAKFPDIDFLDLTWNDITELDLPHSLPAITWMSLVGNKLTSFNVSLFPNVAYLDLSDNGLKEIPESLVQLPKVYALLMHGNPFKSLTISEKLYAYLANIKYLGLDAKPELTQDCGAGVKRNLSDVMVCVTANSDAGGSSAATVLPGKDNTTAATGKSGPPYGLILGITGALFVVVAAIVCGIVWRRRRKANADAASSQGHVTFDPLNTESTPTSLAKKKPTASTTQGSQSTGTGSSGDKLNSNLSLWDDDELLACQLRYEDIRDVRVIGSGAYGIVWLVQYRGNRQYASKRLIKSQITRHKTQEFVKEIKLVAKLDHPSIVSFIGAAWTVETDLQALFEFMPNGDLRSYLDSTRPSHSGSEEWIRVDSRFGADSDEDDDAPTWNREKTQIALDIIEALVYVHSFNPPLVHRDLKSRNVLLDGLMKAKLSDFGVSRFQSEQATMTAGVGTGRWLAPEVLAGSTDYDQSCDMYAFGVVLTELDTHAVPYEDMSTAGVAEVALLQMVVAGRARPRLRKRSPKAIRVLAAECLSATPGARPSAMEAAYRLRTWSRGRRR